MTRRYMLTYLVGGGASYPQLEEQRFRESLLEFKRAWDLWTGMLGEGKYDVRLARAVVRKWKAVQEWLPKD